MITLDGSQGEGGGQILRSALALSVVTRRPFRIERIRAGRAKPGLMRQHLACVDAAARVGCAQVEGSILGSTELTFEPGGIVPGHYEYRIGSAGSTLLLLQTLLPPLMVAERGSELILEGGTHNPFAPPFPFIAEAFLPLLQHIGFKVEAVLERAGFYPNGGGRLHVRIEPPGTLSPLVLEQEVHTYEASLSAEASAQVCLVGLPRSVAGRELEVVRRHLGLRPDRRTIDECPGALGPGNTLHIRIPQEGFTEVFTGFGSPRTRSEAVAQSAIEEAQALLAVGVPVGEYLADQLLLPLALARGGRFLTVAPSEHTRTNAAIIQAFLGNRITLEPAGSGRWQIHVEQGQIT